mmetsp:Transcript_32787/g.61671  ORF Transcript_32787/g.61671 Transcript_32787/m.61671 type:complete len:333 (+) Transcript_32787:564-1562(+)
MFGKILAHRLDERFLDDQEKLVKDTVALLECYFKSKHPNKSEQEIKAMVHARVKDGGFLGGREWRDVINFMYNEDTSDSIVEGVLRLKHNKLSASLSSPRSPSKPSIPASQGTSSPSSYHRRCKRRTSNDSSPNTGFRSGESSILDRVRFADFMHVILADNLVGHEMNIMPVVKAIRMLDRDQMGYLDVFQLHQVCCTVSLPLTAHEQQLLLKEVDPSGSGKANASSIIRAVSSRLGYIRSLTRNYGDERKSRWETSSTGLRDAHRRDASPFPSVDEGPTPTEAIFNSLHVFRTSDEVRVSEGRPESTVLQTSAASCLSIDETVIDKGLTHG